MQKIEKGHSELPPIFDVLNNLVSDQKNESNSIKFPPDFLAWEKWFISTARFKKTYEDAVKFSLLPHNAEEHELNGHNLAGKMFEDLAYLIISSEEAKRQRVLLSPERTLSLWERLYPSAQKHKLSPHQTGLSGISVPDGVIVKCADKICTVISVCEYSLSRSRDLSNKKFGFGENKKTFPNLLAQAEFIFITANGGHDSEESKKLPFSNRRFHEFAEFVFKGYSPMDGSATLRDIQERVNEQYGRAVDHSKLKKLTGEEEKYLNKVASSPQLI